MKKYFLTITMFLFFCAFLPAQESNLQSFFIKDKNNVPYLGYVEPVSNNDNQKAKLLVFPVVTVYKSDVVLEHDTGENITSIYALPDENIHGRVSVKIDINDLANNRNVLNKLMLTFHPEIILASGGIIEKPTKAKFPCPDLVGDNIITQSHIDNMLASYIGSYQQEMGLYDQQVFKVNSMLAKYSVVPIFPRGLKFTILVNGEEIASKEFAFNSSINSGSIFDIPISNNIASSNYRNLMEGEFVLQTEFQFLTSRFQSASAKINLTGYTNYFVDAFKEAINNVSESSSGIFFWKTTQQRIRRFIQERSNESLNSVNSQDVEYRLYDVDDAALVKQVESFLFSEITIESTIENHKQAAQKAKDANNVQLQNIHNDYVKYLEENKGNLGTSNQVDVTKALAALAKDDLIGFLANGFSFSNNNVKDSFTFRKIAVKNFSESETNSFNALIFKSLYQKHLISQKPM